MNVRVVRIMFLILGLAIVAELSPICIPELSAQEGSLFVSVKHREGADHPPLMLSVIRDGEIVRQEEVVPYMTGESLVLFKLPPSLYDVRIEGERIRAAVKRGINVFPEYDGESRRDTKIHFIIEYGSGVHVVEYSSSAVSRDELAARVARLEAVIAQLQEP